MLHFHSKKPEFLKQEIYANLILYNFGIFLANEAAKENDKKTRKKSNKYQYSVVYRVYEIAENYAPDYDIEAICEEFRKVYC